MGDALGRVRGEADDLQGRRGRRGRQTNQIRTVKIRAMPYRHIWETRGAVREYSGDVVDHEYITAAIEFQADRRFDAMRYLIHDFTRCHSFALSDSNIEDLAARAAAATRRFRYWRVAIVTSDPNVAVIAAKFEALHFGEQVFRLFRTMDEARAWVAEPHLWGPSA